MTWDTFDQVLAVWGATGFATFTVAGLFQLARVDKQMVEAIRRVKEKKEGIFQAFAPGRIGVAVDASTSGIVAGIGFGMATSAFAVGAIR